MVAHNARAALLLVCCSPRAPPPRLQVADFAVLLVRPGDDESIATGLAHSLGDGLPLVRVNGVNELDGGNNVRAVFELNACAESMELHEYCAANGADLYRWTPSVAMFKRMLGGAGPAYIATGSAAGNSEDIEVERRGWGYLLSLIHI